jgi:hypothetical protein
MGLIRSSTSYAAPAKEAPNHGQSPAQEAGSHAHLLQVLARRPHPVRSKHRFAVATLWVVGAVIVLQPRPGRWS